MAMPRAAAGREGNRGVRRSGRLVAKYVSDTGTDCERHSAIEDAAAADGDEAEHPEWVSQEIAQMEKNEQQARASQRGEDADEA